MFIIDNKGIVRQITINDHTVGRSVPETCRLIKAIQYADKAHEPTPNIINTEGSEENDNYEMLLNVFFFYQ
jgi:alkyl hydroperoxide reductase subunit AhpC